jgi:pimeloyl-ACP methyl ester carboxylesterase
VLLPSATGDWTNQNPSHDVPAVRQIYAIFGAADRIENVHFDAPHHYNRDAREHMYAWFCRWLMNDLKAGRRIEEAELRPPTTALRLFPAGKPPRGYRTGKALLRDLDARGGAAFANPPASAAGLRALKTAWREVYSEVIGAVQPKEIVSVGAHSDRGRTRQFSLAARVLGRYGRGEQTPALWVTPPGANANSPAALAVCGNGKAELFRKGAPSPLLSALLKAGFRVLAIDLLGQGETKPLLERVREDLKDPLFYAFNRSLTAHRIQEILVALAALRQYDGVKSPAIVGTGVGAVLALLARPLAGDLRGTAADLRGCRIGDDAFWLGEMYHPFIRRLGDARGAVALAPASPLLLAGADKELCRWSRTVYRLQGKPRSLRLVAGALAPRAVANWL